MAEESINYKKIIEDLQTKYEKLIEAQRMIIGNLEERIDELKGKGPSARYVI